MVLRPEDLVRHITPTVEQEREAKQFILKAFLDCYQHVITQEHQHMLNKERRLDESFAHQTTKTSLDDAMMDVNNLEKAIVTGAEIVVDESLRVMKQYHYDKHWSHVKQQTGRVEGMIYHAILQVENWIIHDPKRRPTVLSQVTWQDDWWEGASNDIDQVFETMLQESLRRDKFLEINLGSIVRILVVMYVARRILPRSKHDASEAQDDAYWIIHPLIMGVLNAIDKQPPRLQPAPKLLGLPRKPRVSTLSRLRGWFGTSDEKEGRPDEKGYYRVRSLARERREVELKGHENQAYITSRMAARYKL